MSVMTISGKAVRKRIENSEHQVEQWKIDHQEAEKCRRFEKWLSAVMEIYYLIEELDDAWRTDVFRGVVPYNNEDHKLIQKLFESWLRLEILAKPFLLLYEGQFSDGVDGANEFRECCERARNHRSSSDPPTASVAIGLRDVTLDVDDSREIAEMMKKASQQPRSPVRPIETVDASFLLRQ